MSTNSTESFLLLEYLYNLFLFSIFEKKYRYCTGFTKTLLSEYYAK